MKISQENYQVILTHFKSINKIAFFNHKEEVIQSKNYSDLQMRLRWDCIRWKNPSQNMFYFICDHLYKKGLNDKHIDSALKKAMKESGLLIIAEEKEKLHTFNISISDLLE
jgi:hypothetical protein